MSGIGLGFLFPSVPSAVQASVTTDHVPMALAMFGFFRSLGQVIGVAIGTVIFQSRMIANLKKYESLASNAAAYSGDAAGLVQLIKTMDDGQVKGDLKQAYVDSLRIVWAVCCAIAGASFFLSLLTESYSVDHIQNTGQGVIEKNEKTSIQLHAQVES